MNETDHELFEAELRKLKPARPPADLMARLLEAPKGVEAGQPAGASGSRAVGPSRVSISMLLRWLAGAAAATALVSLLLVLWQHPRKDAQHAKAAPVSRRNAPEAEDIEIDRQLVGLFDTVAKLPNGEPVRFRCREWADEVVLRDAARGLVIERRTPRLEVVPVGAETF